MTKQVKRLGPEQRLLEYSVRIDIAFAIETALTSRQHATTILLIK